MRESLEEFKGPFLYFVIGISIFVGGLIGINKAQLIEGVLKGALIGFGLSIVLSFIINCIAEPYILLSFVVFSPVGFLIGLIWGLNGAIYGSYFAAAIAFIFCAGLFKREVSEPLYELIQLVFKKSKRD